MSETQPIFITDVGPPEPRHIFQARPDSPEVTITFPPGCRFRVYVDDEGFVTGIETRYEKAVENGHRWLLNDDYFFEPPAGRTHTDFIQKAGTSR